uniref:UBX domain-containing protein n=1 Tax=Syphacia muris TaxID=451379 RepID=A0A158R537_9BILA
MSESSLDRDELITRFMEVCAVDHDVAEQVLVHNDWNIETAVQNYFQSSTSTGGWEEEQNSMNHEQELRHRRHSSGNNVDTFENNSTYSSFSLNSSLRRKSPPLMTWSQWTMSLIKLPFEFVYRTFLDILRFFLSLLKNPVLAVADPRGDVQGFIEDFNEHFPNARNRLNWSTLSYNEVLNECKRNLSFLLVYLHNPSHQDSEKFVNEKLLSDQMLYFIERNRLVLWGVSVRSQEGYKVSMALRENTYPFLGLICMRSSRMVLRIEGEYDLDSMIFAIQSAINENQVHLDTVRIEREQREADSRIRREQEADYERGLAADRAKLDKKRKQELERKKALEKAEQEKRDFERKLQRFVEMKSRLRDTLPPESLESDTVRMNIRFPCGAHFERRFSLDDSLESLFVATFVHDKCPMNFSMYTSYPRKQLHCAPEWYKEFGTVLNDPNHIPTFREAAFERSETILIQDNDA